MPSGRRPRMVVRPSVFRSYATTAFHGAHAATIVENLPAGILEWTGNTLAPDLSRVLAGGNYPSIWQAAANLLSREGSNLWLDHLEVMVSRLYESRHRPSESFWNHMACNAYLLAAGGNEAQHDVQTRIEQILARGVQDAMQDGLRQMRERRAESREFLRRSLRQAAYLSSSR